MKKGIFFSTAYGDTVAESMKAIADAGFDNIMGSHKSLNEMKMIADEAEKVGLYIDQIHAPFKSINAIWMNDPLGDEVCQSIKDAITVASDLSIPNVAIHLSAGDGAPHVTDIGIERFKSLVEYAIEKNVVAAFENQRKIGNLSVMLEMYNDCKNVGFCWDCGHEGCFTPGREYMPLFGKKLVCTHIHDNMGNYDEDLHLIPFEGTLDFKRFGEHIKKFGYQGTLNLEINKIRKDGRYNDRDPKEFLAAAYSALCKIEGYCL